MSAQAGGRTRPSARPVKPCERCERPMTVLGDGAVTHPACSMPAGVVDGERACRPCADGKHPMCEGGWATSEPWFTGCACPCLAGAWS